MRSVSVLLSYVGCVLPAAPRAHNIPCWNKWGLEKAKKCKELYFFLLYSLALLTACGNQMQKSRKAPKSAVTPKEFGESKELNLWGMALPRIPLRTSSWYCTPYSELKLIALGIRPKWLKWILDSISKPHKYMKIVVELFVCWALWTTVMSKYLWRKC